MRDNLLKLYRSMRRLCSEETGQDLVEYALIVALIALACTAGMNKLASGLKGAFSSIATTLSSDT
jgi:pilus assembly protein Flp/PilA